MPIAVGLGVASSVRAMSLAMRSRAIWDLPENDLAGRCLKLALAISLLVADSPPVPTCPYDQSRPSDAAVLPLQSSRSDDRHLETFMLQLRGRTYNRPSLTASPPTCQRTRWDSVLVSRLHHVDLCGSMWRKASFARIVPQPIRPTSWVRIL